MSETPKLKKIYEDETGLVYIQIVQNEDKQERIVVHSHLKVDKTPEVLKHAREVSMMIDLTMKEKGVKTLYTWSTNETEERYNEFLGYTPTGEEVLIPGYQGDPVYEFSKEL